MKYTIKELTIDDLDSLDSFFTTLSNLTAAPKQTRERTEELLFDINSQGSKIFIAIMPDGEIIGSITLMVEQKMVRGGAKAGHIEDVVVREGYQESGIGSALVKTVVQDAKDCGCYKIIADCAPQFIPWYEKCGFKNEGAFMRMYL